jgi:hypothetical protein
MMSVQTLLDSALSYWPMVSVVSACGNGVIMVVHLHNMPVTAALFVQSLDSMSVCCCAACIHDCILLTTLRAVTDGLLHCLR